MPTYSPFRNFPSVPPIEDSPSPSQPPYSRPMPLRTSSRDTPRDVRASFPLVTRKPPPPPLTTTMKTTPTTTADELDPTAGPPTTQRHSRLPLFNHVRSMLHKPPKLGTPSSPQWDQHHHDTGRGRETTRRPVAVAVASPYSTPPQVAHTPLRSVEPYHSASLAPSHAHHQSLDNRRQSRSSPVSVLAAAADDDDDAQAWKRLRNTQNWSPVSPLSPNDSLPPSPVSCTPPVMTARMTKPPSIDPINPPIPADAPVSRFSWSTATTTLTAGHYPPRPDSPPPSPPPPMPAKYDPRPPMQSILSRRRPVQRLSHSPPPPPPPAPAATRPRPTAARTPQHPSTKALPPPPPPSHPSPTHLDLLLAAERDLQLQARNVRTSLRDVDAVLSASPLDVAFSTVRAARRRREALLRRDDDVTCGLREVGVMIARARRREGGEEGLWVRRVTG